MKGKIPTLANLRILVLNFCLFSNPIKIYTHNLIIITIDITLICSRKSLNHYKSCIIASMGRIQSL